MKTVLSQSRQSIGCFKIALLAAAALLVSNNTNVCKAAAFDSPVGTWDLISSGAGQNGIAFITFQNDGTFNGYHLWAPNPPKKPSTNPRGGTESGRNASGDTSGKTNTFVFGFDDISGRWNYDSKGKVIGFFSVLLDVTSTTYAPGTIQTNINPNVLGTWPTNITVSFEQGVASVATNLSWPSFTNLYTIFNTNVVAGLATKTNTVNFTGTVVPGKRLNMVASTAFGKTTYKGIPFRPVLDLSGSWVGTKKVGPQSFYEFFDLAATAQPNIYVSENEIGAGYTFSAVAMVSQQKKIGFSATESIGTNTLLRATSGSFSTSKGKVSVKTKGVIEPVTGVSFNAFLQSAP